MFVAWMCDASIFGILDRCYRFLIASCSDHSVLAGGLRCSSCDRIGFGIEREPGRDYQRSIFCAVARGGRLHFRLTPKSICSTIENMPPAAIEETHFQVLRIVDSRPELTQRELADELGVSIGKANYVLNALIEKGLVKARNFKNSRNKAAYAYCLTPAGIEEKGRVTVRFLRRKMEEYEQMRKEIEELRKEVGE